MNKEPIGYYGFLTHHNLQGSQTGKDKNLLGR